MEQTKKTLITEQLNLILAARSTCAEAKEAAQKWLDAAAAGAEDAETPALVEELKEDLMTIDDLIGFLGTPHAAEIFGAEGAVKALEGAQAAKADGAKYCTCDACAACEAILTALGEI